MISVKVKAILDLAEVFGGREQIISLSDGSQVSNLLDILESKYGKFFTEIMYKDENQELSSVYVLMLNGRNIAFLDGLQSVLNDGDELFFLSPVGGG